MYVGSDLHCKIEDYLNSYVAEDQPVSEMFKSDTNQSFFKELSIGVIGSGQIFGETDAYNGRKNSYQLRSKTPNAEVFAVPSH